MKNELFSIGPVTIYGYGLMIAIGIVSAYLVTEYRAKKAGKDLDLIFSFTIWSVGGGILGAKLLFVLTQIKEIIANPKIMLNVSDGFVVYGGIIGGILTAFVFCKIKKLSFLEHFDLAIPTVALAQGFGRIGCFLAGCCYGRETSCAIGITFHNSSFAPNNISLLPTQLISSGLNFLNFFVLLFFSRRNKKQGRIGALYLLFYGSGRFVLEFFRGDIERGNVGVLSTSQFISIFIVLAGVVMFIVTSLRKTEKERAEQERPEQEIPEQEKVEQEIPEQEMPEQERAEQEIPEPRETATSAE